MNEATTPAQAPAPLTPADIGAQMAALRERFNLSQQEVSERLHIRPRYVNAIEEGRYEMMPGKVYARGYVHTYAEFLGMNADDVVAQCFAGELPSNAQPIPPIAAARYASPTARVNSTSSSGHWRGYAVLGAIVLVVVVIVAQFRGHDTDTPKVEEATVAPVPEAMLASMRTLVMPLPQNYECLMHDVLLACLNADETAYLLSHLDMNSVAYGGPIDVSQVVVGPMADEVPAAENAAAKTDEVPAAENPDSPPVATMPEASTTDEGPNRTPPHDD